MLRQPRERGLEPDPGVDRAPQGRSFLGHPMKPPAAVRSLAFDRVAIASFDPPDAAIAELRPLGVPREQVLAPHPTAGADPQRLLEG